MNRFEGMTVETLSLCDMPNYSESIDRSMGRRHTPVQEVGDAQLSMPGVQVPRLAAQKIGSM